MCGFGDVAYNAGDVAIFSEVESFERAVRASGKFGGVAGVLAGAHICNKSNMIKVKIRHQHQVQIL